VRIKKFHHDTVNCFGPSTQFYESLQLKNFTESIVNYKSFGILLSLYAGVRGE